jgi:hypothetical protein
MFSMTFFGYIPLQPRRSCYTSLTVKWLEFGHFPRRGSVLQPRVAVLGYPGKDGGEFPNPTGVVAESPRVPNRIGLSRIAFGVHGAFDVKPCHNPVGVARIIAAIPKVAEYSNLDLWGATPLGLRGSSLPFPRQPSTATLGFGPQPRWGCVATEGGAKKSAFDHAYFRPRVYDARAAQGCGVRCDAPAGRLVEQQSRQRAGCLS